MHTTASELMYKGADYLGVGVVLNLEVFYKCQHRRSSLEYLTPVAYEEWEQPPPDLASFARLASVHETGATPCAGSCWTRRACHAASNRLEIIALLGSRNLPVSRAVRVVTRALPLLMVPSEAKWGPRDKCCCPPVVLFHSHFCRAAKLRVNLNNGRSRVCTGYAS